MSVESSCVGILQALFASGICRPGARTVKFESGFYCYHHFLPFSSFLFMKQPGLYLLVDYQSPFHLILSRVCTMRPFFLNFLVDTLKSCEISLPIGKKSFFIISNIFQVAPPIFWPLKSPKLRKCPYLSNLWSFEVLWPLILTGTCMFLYVFHTNDTSKTNGSAPKSQNDKNRQK